MNTRMSQDASQSPKPGAGAPWWRFPIVWLVISGPLSVVVASFYSFGVAVRHVDPVLEVTVPATVKPSHAPALVGRNRAAETATQPADH